MNRILLDKPIEITKISKRIKKLKKKIIFNGKEYEINSYNTIQEAFLDLSKEIGIEAIPDKNDKTIFKFFSIWDVESEYLNEDRIYFKADAYLLHKLKFSAIEDPRFGTLNVIEYKHKLVPFLNGVKENLMGGYYTPEDIQGSANLLNRIFCETNKVLFSMDYVDLFQIYNIEMGMTHLHFWDLFISQKVWGTEFNIKNGNKLVDIDYFDTWANFINVVYEVEEKMTRCFENNFNNSRKLSQFFKYLVGKYKLKKGCTITFDENLWCLSPYMIDNAHNKYDMYEYIESHNSTLNDIYSESEKYHNLRVEYSKLYWERKAYISGKEIFISDDLRKFLNGKFGEVPDSKFREIGITSWENISSNPTKDGSVIRFFTKKIGVNGFDFRDQCGLVPAIWFDKFFSSFTNEGQSWGIGDEISAFIPKAKFNRAIQNNTKQSFKEIKTSRKIIDRIIDSSFEKYLDGESFKTFNELLTEIETEMRQLQNACKSKRGVFDLEDEINRINKEAIKNSPLAVSGMVDFRRPGYFNAMERAMKQHRSIYSSKISAVETQLQHANYRAYVDYIGQISGKSFKGGLYRCGY